MRTALRDRDLDDSGMTLVEVTVTSLVLLVLMGMVLVTLTMVESIGGSVSSQYQEVQQALPEMAPFHSLLAAEVEPAPVVGGVPTPGFDPSNMGNFSLTFYANVGTAFGNSVSCPSGPTCATGTTAGPAKIVAVEVGPNGSPVPATACSVAFPCSFELRMYLPLTGLTAPGVSSCPDVGTGPTCQYGTGYRLLVNVHYVVNDPSSTGGTPIFSYTLFDTGGTFGATTYPGQAISLSAAEVATNQITGLRSIGYPTDTQQLTACAAPSASYPTLAVSCPLDAIQSVNIDLQVALPGTGATGAQENSLVVYRYAQSPGSATAPYQYSATVG
jgi:hypothetical protein